MSTAMNEIGKVYERPWGSYQTLAMANNYQIKLITVKPQQKLSLQKHFHRAEHWMVIQGQATVTLNDQVKQLQLNDYIFIPKEALHRLENATSSPIAIIEIQIGDYLGEDDIVRFDDIYGRL